MYVRSLFVSLLNNQNKTYNAVGKQQRMFLLKNWNFNACHKDICKIDSPGKQKIQKKGGFFIFKTNAIKPGAYLFIYNVNKALVASHSKQNVYLSAYISDTYLSMSVGSSAENGIFSLLVAIVKLPTTVTVVSIPLHRLDGIHSRC